MQIFEYFFWRVSTSWTYSRHSSLYDFFLKFTFFSHIIYIPSKVFFIKKNLHIFYEVFFSKNVLRFIFYSYFFLTNTHYFFNFLNFFCKVFLIFLMVNYPHFHVCWKDKFQGYILRPNSDCFNWQMHCSKAYRARK